MNAGWLVDIGAAVGGVLGIGVAGAWISWRNRKIARQIAAHYPKTRKFYDAR